MSVSRTVSCLLVFPVLTLIAAQLHAQEKETKPGHAHPHDPPRQGVVLVKIDGERLRAPIDAASFGEPARRYGIHDVHPWIPPALLYYGLPVFKASANTGSIASLSRIMEVRYSSADASEDVAAVLGMVPGVEYAEPSFQRRPAFNVNDQFVGNQWYLDTIKARAAWDVVRADSTIIIAITDTGIDPNHEDLKSSIWLNPGENGSGPNGDKRSDGIDNDGNGVVDDWMGYDFSGADGANPDNDPTATGDGHGIEVAGVAAAIGNNAVGIAGVAFGARLMIVKVADDRPAPQTRIYNGPLGVLYAARMGAGVINCSWGGESPSLAEAEVFEYVVHDLKKTVVASAGNDNVDSYNYPASYPGVISVAALTEGNAKASFSNYNDRVDVSAPGTDIYSTVKNGYFYDQGTSFSAPIVSGIAALVAKKYPQLDGQQVGEVIRATTDNIDIYLGGTYGGRMGTGRVDAARAVTLGPSVASARMIDYSVSESVPDGALEPNETIELRAGIRNLLADAAFVDAKLTVEDPPGISVQNDSVAFGAVPSGARREIPAGSFRFTLPASIASNSDVRLKVTVETPDRTNAHTIILRAAPTYLTTHFNKIALTFNGRGNLAKDGLDQDAGDGFLYAFNESILFHGGVMIGTDNSRFADAVRLGRLSQGTGEGFTTVRPYRLAIAQDSSAEIGTAEFADAVGSLGINVTMRTEEYRDTAAQNIVFVRYMIRNTGAAALDGLRCGLYLDWDVSGNGLNDRVQYDPDNAIAFQRDANTTSGRPFVGALMLSPGTMNFYAVKNFDDSVNTNFTAARKWTMMTSGIHENAGLDDMSMVVSSDGFTLPANASKEVAFALIAAPTFDSLRANARIARARFGTTGVATPGIEGFAATFLPNPVADRTTLRMSLPEASRAVLTIYTLQGERALSFDTGTLDAGAHEIPVEMAAMPAGLYVYEVQAGGRTVRGKLLKAPH